MSQLKYLLVLVLGTFCAVANAKIINCYFGTWSNYRPGNGRFISSDVDANLCTHLSYSFFGINEAGEVKNLDTWLDDGLKSIQNAIELKKINPKLKVLLVVGGWNEQPTKYSNMAANANMRQTFIRTALDKIKEYGFDGLDLDWEYPGQRGGSPQDKQNFVTLLKEIKEAFTPLNLELGIAVGASEVTAKISYDIPNISKYVDFINVMTYDFAMGSDRKLGFNAPLRGQGQNNVETSIKYWLANGAPASKLILGLAFYGRTFQLSNTAQTTPGSPSTGPGQAGPFTREKGYMGYNEICSVVSSWTSVFDDAYGNPYMYKGDQWVSYDNVKSIEMKVDFLNQMNLGGAMLWSIETDDFRGDCGEKYPLLKAINRKMGRSSANPSITTKRPETSNTRRPVVTPTAAPTASPMAAPTAGPPSVGDCSKNGLFPNENACSRYYECVGGVRYDRECGAGTLYHSGLHVCVWPDQTDCKKKK